MGLRSPSEAIQLPILEELNALKWHTLECELVTPMYGGGVDAATVDLKMPIRVSAIKGQLRFWWRLLAKNKKDDTWDFNGNLKNIRDAEFALWGGQGDDDGGRASQVFLKVTQPKVTHHDLVEYTEYLDASPSNKKLSYVLFPASNAEDKVSNPHKLLNAEKAKFKLSFSLSNTLKNQEKMTQQIVETLRWWANFGGIGARTRKGLGAIHISESWDYPMICQPLTESEITAANCAMSLKGKSANALAQLYSGIQKLSDFRQKAEVGRNKGQAPKPAGRSRWPEPDALRRIQKTHHENHAPEHQAGNVFPRAFFGLPIIFHFVGRGEPRDSQLAPIDGDRLASPLFIRPFYLGKNGKGEKEWASCALVTPYEHIKNMNVSLGRNETYPVWKSDTAQHIRPIQDQQGTDPLDAFLKYFAK
ncbi:type III-B CRISPR module RAMP protein Cmr1 [Acinetobacter towneri]|uniref:type III-B CRISPR module RAMP protein Cmr1 n=1 Tax=Acinetobacter towneri TaxID=202956 RepID=UPI00293687D7|nr:type III-B CRISPR module RAMP protein Cmr1 [Acinetobacter towneri]MDV2455791.1 type III-B CRISPR module RAMP protein Cmr1 [Acinetobacter towneri]